MDQRIKDVVDAAWGAAFGIAPSTFSAGGVHIVVAEPGVSDAASVLIGRACVVRVPASIADTARDLFSGMNGQDAFTPEALRELVGHQAPVFDPSWHHYGDERSLRTGHDAASQQIEGSDPALLRFLQSNSIDDWAESGFPEDPAAADPEETMFYVLRTANEIVAAGNMTDWRGMPADLGVLVHPSERGRGLALRLTGAMTAEALPRVDVVRYRALSTNTASLTVAERLGFERYGGNYLGRLAST